MNIELVAGYVIAGCLFTLFVWPRETFIGGVLSVAFFPLLLLKMALDTFVLYVGDTYLIYLLTTNRDTKRDAVMVRLLVKYSVMLAAAGEVNNAKLNKSEHTSSSGLGDDTIRKE